MRGLIVLALCLVAAVVADPVRLAKSQRIIGGSVTTINQYPFGTALLYSWNSNAYWQSCGGTAITTVTVLTAAHCVFRDTINQWRARVGSSFANSGGTVHTLNRILIHPNYNSWTQESDVALLRTSTSMGVPVASIAGANYNLADNQAVWAIGWGHTSYQGVASEQLRHVQVWTVNQATCNSRYQEVGASISNTMLCSGWLDVGGRDQCQGDSGGPLLHNNVVVGVCSWGQDCALARYPGVNARVSSFSAWIVSNA